jgi:hypothetical protein
MNNGTRIFSRIFSMSCVDGDKTRQLSFLADECLNPKLKTRLEAISSLHIVDPVCPLSPGSCAFAFPQVNVPSLFPFQN